MSILDMLSEREVWDGFLEHKRKSDFFPKGEERALREFIEREEYLPVCERIARGEPFPLPSVIRVNKSHTDKKRTVFVFPESENYVLKLMAYLLYEYDGIFHRNLYSFRRRVGVKQALISLLKKNGGNRLYSYKVDIHDYFNSVDTDIITGILEERLKDDPALMRFLVALLREPRAKVGGEEAVVQKGIMAGVPISGFLANLYLNELDGWFYSRGIPYARYSDDIIVLAESEESLCEYEGVIKEYLRKMKLEVNERKELRSAPGEDWEFLGFRISTNAVDISASSLRKMKDKMKRKADALVRWRKRRGAEPNWAVRAHIKHFNRKLYENRSEHELTWCKWYFPTINTPESLHILDEYMVACLRYIATGRYTKANYNLRYETLKQLGYRSLVNEFYKFKRESEASALIKGEEK